jgi:hypothetical protein
MVGDLLSAVKEVLALIKYFSKSRIEKSILKQDFLEEVEDNLKLLKVDYLQNDADLIGIIQLLKNDAAKRMISRAKEKKFNYNDFKKGKVSPSIFENLKSYQQMKDFDAERFIKNISKKIEELKAFPVLYPNLKSKKIRPRARLNNLIRMYVLFMRHLDLD